MTLMFHHNNDYTIIVSQDPVGIPRNQIFISLHNTNLAKHLKKIKNTILRKQPTQVVVVASGIHDFSHMWFTYDRS